MSKLEDEESWSLLAQSTTESTLAIANYIRTGLLAVAYGVVVAFFWSLGSTLQVSNALSCDFLNADPSCKLVVPEYLTGLAFMWELPLLLAFGTLVFGVVHLYLAFTTATRFRQLATATVSIDD